jgi:hypothetical protein
MHLVDGMAALEFQIQVAVVLVRKLKVSHPVVPAL